MSWSTGYREWLPPPELIPGLACLWVRVAGDDGRTPTLVFPDGCVDLIWQEGRGAFLAGPDTGPMPVVLAAGTVMVGARFSPGAGEPALGLPLAELCNQRVDIDGLRPDLHPLLPPDLSRDQAQARLLGLSAHLITQGPPDPLVLEAVGRVADPRARVADLPDVLHVSERQLRRRFEAAVGYGPKTLQRVLRFQRFLEGVGSPPGKAGLAGLAATVGYADQAHLSREVVRLSGMSPGDLARMRASSLGEADESGHGNRQRPGAVKPPPPRVVVVRPRPPSWPGPPPAQR